MRLAKIFLVVARPSPIAFASTGEESETACNRPANDNLHHHGVPGGHLVKTQTLALSRDLGPARPPTLGSLNNESSVPAELQPPSGEARMPATVVISIVMMLPLLILGLVALLRARPEDIPSVIAALARWGRK